MNIGYFYGPNDAAVGTETLALADCIALMNERGAVELLTCFRAMTPPQRSVFLEFGKLLAAGNGATTEQQGATANGRRTRAWH